MRRTLFTAALLVPALAAAPPRLAAEEILLFDDFNGPPLNASLWGLADWTIGDRTQFGNQPTFAAEGPDPDKPTTFIRLPLDTYSPVQPGQRLYGTEIYSLQNFDNAGGVEYVARARLATDMPGLVAAFFTYNQRRQKGRWLSDEIDFEVLSKQAFDTVLVTSWDDWGAAGSDYEDGVHHLGALLALNALPELTGFDWRQWNDYMIRWYPDRVEWYVNEVLVHSQAAPVPDLAQPVRASLWAAGTTWPDAYDALLAPVATEASNRSFAWDVDFIMVTRLGGDGGGGTEIPAAPSGLAANVNGSEVRLNWTDNADDETGFVVYRAWKPKGKASPDFNAIAQAGANATAWTDTAPSGEHLYRVTAQNAAGESPPSNTVGVLVGSGGKPKP